MTPLKLKRKIPHLESTLDRTLCPNVGESLKDVIPSFIATSKEIPPKIVTIKQEPINPVSLSAFENTTEYEEKVYQIMNEDTEKSECSSRNWFRNRPYIDYPAKLKIVKGSTWAFPSRVVEIYSNSENKQNEKPSFVQGCLSKTAIYYFAIQNIVLFYDIGRAIRYNLEIQECFLKEVQFETRVFELKEITWSNPFFSELKNKNIILVSSPWKINFVALQLPDQGKLDAEDYKRWMKITLLNYHFILNSKKADFLTEGNREIFYLDEHGQVNRLWFQRSNFVDKLFHGDKFKWLSDKRNNPISSNFFYLNRKASFLDKIRHYNKVIKTEIVNVFTKNAERYGLVYDHSRKLLFSMVDTRYHGNLSQKSIEYSYSKMISCWKTVENKLELQCEISEVQLLTSPENQHILNYNIGKNNKLSQILPVQEAYYPESCLLLVLQNGIRLYLSIRDNKFQVASFQYPPSFQCIINQKGTNRKCCQYTKPVQLVSFLSEASSHLMTVYEDGINHTFFIWKDHQMKEEETCTYLPWGESIISGEKGDLPRQNYFFKPQIFFSNLNKGSLLKSLEKKNDMQNLFNSKNIRSMHNLARDLLVNSTTFLHSTEMYIEYFFITRPVDLLFMAIQSQISHKKVLFKIFPQLDKKDIQMLLLQILCDEEANYIKDDQIVQCFNQYCKSCIENGVFKDFDTFQKEFFNSSSKKSKWSEKKHNQKLEKSEITGTSTLTLEKRLKICDIVLDLCSEEKQNNWGESNGEKYNTEINVIIDCVLTLLSRLLRYLWTQELYEISPKTVKIVPFLQSILKVIDFIFDNDYLSRAQIEINSKRYAVFETMKRIQSKTSKQFNIKENKEKPSFERSKEKIEKLKFFIHKIIQFIFLSCQVQFKMKKKFFTCLGVKPQLFESYIFNYLIINYNQPFKVLDQYRKIFPLFISKNLEKSLKIYNETKKLNSDSAYQAVKQHSNLPDYLLAYLKSQKKIKSWEIKNIKAKKDEQMKIDFSFGSREAIEELLTKLTIDFLNYHQRNHLIKLINNQLQLYISARKYVEDSFYLSTKREVSELSKILTFQEILLEEYQKNQSKKNDVIKLLKNSIIKLQGLKSIVDVIKVRSIKIIYTYYFGSFQLQSQLENFFKEEKEIFNTDYSSSGFKMTEFFGSKRKQKSWKHLQQQLKFIIGKIRNFTKLQQLIQIMGISMVLFDEQKLIIKTFSNLLQYINQQKESKSLTNWIMSYDYPIISLMLVSGGLDCIELQESYLKSLHYQIYSQKNTNTLLLLNIWLNLYVLLFEFGGKLVYQFSAKTMELLSKIRNSPPLSRLIEGKKLQEIEKLSEILNLVNEQRSEKRKK